MARGWSPVGPQGGLSSKLPASTSAMPSLKMRPKKWGAEPDYSSTGMFRQKVALDRAGMSSVLFILRPAPRLAPGGAFAKSRTSPSPSRNEHQHPGQVPDNGHSDQR